MFDRLARELGPGAAPLRDRIAGGSIPHHDERAAAVCLATALAVHSGRYVAIGAPAHGYLFLPPWSLWTGWARDGLDRNRRDPRLRSAVDVWIDGERFGPADRLPRTVASTAA